MHRRDVERDRRRQESARAATQQCRGSDQRQQREQWLHAGRRRQGPEPEAQVLLPRWD